MYTEVAMRRLLWIAVAGITLLGCGASRQAFEPSERVQGRTLQGNKVAIYPLSAGSTMFGEAKVWSHGAYRTKDGPTVVHAALEIHNTAAAPIEIRRGEVTLDVLHSNDGPIKGLRPTEDGTRTFQQGAIGEAHFVFPLPEGVSPRDVDALRLHWRVHHGELTYAQRTPFREEVQPRYGYYNYPYAYGFPCWPYGPYDCMFTGPWGPGFYGPVVVPRSVPYPTTRTRVRPAR
jgi:hypothetical protein